MSQFDTGKDFDGTELKIGDQVAFVAPYVKGLAKGTVAGFTPKMIEIEWSPWTNRPEQTEKILRNISWVVKVPT